MKSILTVAALVLCAAKGPASSQGVEDFKKLRVTVSVVKRNCIELEPVRLQISVENKSGGDVPGPRALSSSVRIHVAAPGKEFRLFRLHGVPVGDIAGDATVFPHGWKGQVVKSVFYRNAATGGHVFPEPGTYRCKAILHWRGREIESAVIPIVIAKPGLPVDVAGAEFLRDNDLDKYMTDEAHRFESDGETLGRIRAFFARFPGSTYEHYLRFGLGRIIFARSTPTRTRKNFDVDGLREAIALCRPCANADGHPFAIDAAYYAGKACYWVRDLPEAKGLLQAVANSGRFRYSEDARRSLNRIGVREAFQKAQKEK